MTVWFSDIVDYTLEQQCKKQIYHVRKYLQNCQNLSSTTFLLTHILRTLDIAGSMRTCKEKLIHYLRTYAEVFALGQPSIDNYIALVDRLEA